MQPLKPQQQPVPAPIQYDDDFEDHGPALRISRPTQLSSMSELLDSRQREAARIRQEARAIIAATSSPSKSFSIDSQQQSQQNQQLSSSSNGSVARTSSLSSPEGTEQLVAPYPGFSKRLRRPSLPGSAQSALQHISNEQRASMHLAIVNTLRQLSRDLFRDANYRILINDLELDLLIKRCKHSFEPSPIAAVRGMPPLCSALEHLSDVHRERMTFATMSDLIAEVRYRMKIEEVRFHLVRLQSQLFPSAAPTKSPDPKRNTAQNRTVTQRLIDMCYPSWTEDELGALFAAAGDSMTRCIGIIIKFCKQGSTFVQPQDLITSVAQFVERHKKKTN